MITQEELQRMQCIKCKHTFNIGDAAIVYIDHAGAKRREKKCPQCGGNFRAISIPPDLDKYLYCDLDSRYYR